MFADRTGVISQPVCQDVLRDCNPVSSLHKHKCSAYVLRHGLPSYQHSHRYRPLWLLGESRMPMWSCRANGPNDAAEKSGATWSQQ